MFSSNTTQVSSGGYEIQRSLRFNQADDNYLNRTPASAGTRTTWTWSAWIKRATISDFQYSVFGAGTVNTNYDEFRLTTADKFRFFIVSGGSVVLDLLTTQVFRDPSAWYHFVVAYDSTQATASNRCKLYVNGVQITALDTATYPAQNTNSTINNNVQHTIGLSVPAGFEYNGYQTEINFIDGQALTPSSFGEYNADTGVWQPKRYAGSYGTNGFYLNFSDNSNTTAATLGADYSGNGNNWTPNNFSVSAGAGNDSLVDVPTNWGVDTGVGGTVRGNYSTINPLNANGSTLSNGNLDVTTSTIVGGGRFSGTFAMRSGKWYWEVTPTAVGSQLIVGIASSSETVATEPGFTALSYSYFSTNGQKYNSSIGSSYGSTYTTGDVIGVALDMDAGTIVFYKNGVSQGTAFSSLSGEFVPAFSPSSSTAGTTVNVNFGQRPFAYTAPSGFKALNTQNLPTPTIGATPATQAGKFFNPVLYTGDRTSRTISVGFQPDWVWVKSRNAADDHYLMNVLSGTGKYLSSNSTAAEATNAATLTAFTSDGFSVGNTGTTNETGRTYVAWNWKANGAGVTNTAGSITSTVSANTTSGFSVVTWTNPASGNPTIGHGLGAAPAFIIVKDRTFAYNWDVGCNAIGWNNRLRLNDVASIITPAYWNNTAPTSSVFTYAASGANSGDSLVAYCFSEVPGYSKFGSYTGNGSTDGPFVYTGFRPAYVMIKGTSSGAADTSWIIFDSKRNTFNLTSLCLAANSSDAEFSNDTVVSIDLLSNGFKVRASNASFGINQPSNVYVFAAFAEAPQKFSLAR